MMCGQRSFSDQSVEKSPWLWSPFVAQIEDRSKIEQRSFRVSDAKRQKPAGGGLGAGRPPRDRRSRFFVAAGDEVNPTFTAGIRGGFTRSLPPRRGQISRGHARISASTQASNLHPTQINVKRGPGRSSGWGLSGLDPVSCLGSPFRTKGRTEFLTYRRFHMLNHIAGKISPNRFFWRFSLPHSKTCNGCHPLKQYR